MGASSSVWGIGKPQGGDFDDLYLDVCVEGLEKDPFWRTRLVLKHTHNEGIFFIVYTHIWWLFWSQHGIFMVFIQYPFVFNKSRVFDVKFDQILEFFM